MNELARCPKCKKRDYRMKVEVFVDAPAARYRNLPKSSFRDGRVTVEGVRWETGLFYCNACGFMDRGPCQVRVEPADGKARQHMLEALRSLAREPCRKRNCGSVCLCGPCHAVKALAFYDPGWTR